VTFGQPAPHIGRPHFHAVLDPARDLAPAPLRVQYVIASLPRTGSSRLANRLRSYGCFGYPAEYLDDNAAAIARGRFGVDNPLPAIKAVRTSANGCFGIRAHYGHLPRLLAWEDPATLLSSRFILLTRDDLLGQALSWSRAAQTDSWSPHHGSQVTPTFDAPTIERLIRQAGLYAAGWRMFAAEHALDVLPLTYEALRDDLDGCVERIAAFVGVQLPATRPPDLLPASSWTTTADDTWRAAYIENTRRLLVAGETPRSALVMRSLPGTRTVRAAVKASIRRRLPAWLVQHIAARRRQTG
jgi:LPS sulfotransferase NodH